MHSKPIVRASRLMVPALCLALLGACASPRYADSAPRKGAPVYGGQGHYPSQPAYGNTGVVRAIEPIGFARDQPQGAGAVAGGVLGAIVGRQFGGSNSGKNVGTVIGAVGGAVVGNEIEKGSRRDYSGARVTVELDNGRVRTLDYRDLGDLRVGDRVRLDGNQLVRY